MNMNLNLNVKLKLNLNVEFERETETGTETIPSVPTLSPTTIILPSLSIHIASGLFIVLQGKKKRVKTDKDGQSRVKTDKAG